MKLRSVIQAGAKVLGTKRKLPELKRVLGEAWNNWSSVGAKEDDGGGTALGQDDVLSKRSTKDARVSSRTPRA